MRKLLVVPFVALVLASCNDAPLLQPDVNVRPDGFGTTPVVVMSRNLYLGADIDILLDPSANLPEAIAEALGCTPSQLAIAWLLHRGEHILPIPGTRTVDHLQDDLGALQVKLDADVMTQLDALINQRTVVGSRYNDQGNSEVDTEEF